MKTIWKFPFKVQDRFELEMPGGAQILDVQVQHGQPCIWAVVDTEVPSVKRRFVIVGTGHSMSHYLTGWPHVGTFQEAGGALVWHLFVDPKEA